MLTIQHDVRGGRPNIRQELNADPKLRLVKHCLDHPDLLRAQ